MVLHDLGIKDINNVEKYDLPFIESVTGLIDDLNSGKITPKDFTREELGCLVVLCYAHDFYRLCQGAFLRPVILQVRILKPDLNTAFFQYSPLYL